MNENNDNAVQTPDISEEYLSAFRQCLRITSTGLNVLGKIRAIKKALSAAGMTWPGYVNASDKDGQHHIFECETIQEAGDG